MDYLITFLEGVISFVSPCMLPLLPLYVTYFAGEGDKKQSSFPRAIAFVLGFTTVFSLLGLFAGTLGALLREYRTAVNIAGGALVILFGLSYLEVIRLPLFRGVKDKPRITTVFSAFLFGIVYSLSLTPCVGAFLGSALMMASAAGTSARGVLLLITYSAGMGVPFLLSALLIEKLGSTFDFIKKHYRIINIISGVFLIVTGIAMALGLLGKLTSLLM